MLRFGVTIFLSAFLLFQVQPLVSKRILPWFGGSPAVWTTCMLFFQLLLLGGYVYAHLISTRLGQRRQVMTHLVVLGLAVAALPLLFLPLFFSGFWKPAEPGLPTLRITWLLLAAVGLPYFALSSTSPLLQKWFAAARPEGRVYRLYSLSNVGSLLALVTFPVVMEPFLSTSMLAVLWALGFLAFVLLCGGTALRSMPISECRAPNEMKSEIGNRKSAFGTDAPLQGPTLETAGDHVPRRVWLLWLLLPACASIMLLAVTNEICQDVAVMPFLWVLPLALYLLTFIICFDSERWYFRPIFWPLMVVMIVLMCRLRLAGADAGIVEQVGGYALGLFACAMVCHGELVRLRPGPRRLTAFYLMVAAGGALGGVFVTLVAPLIFKTYVELNAGIWLSAAVALAALWHSLPVDVEPAIRRALRWTGAGFSVIGLAALVLIAVAPFIILAVLPISLNAAQAITDAGTGFGVVIGLGAVALVLIGVGVRAGANLMPWPWLLSLLAAIGLAPLGWVLVDNAVVAQKGYIRISRNFYGVLRVAERFKTIPDVHSYTLTHGRIKHGVQFTGSLRRTPVSYYGRDTGLGLAIAHYPALLQSDGRIKLAMVGLGTGTVAAYGRKGDEFTFYEINADVVKLADENPFTYLADSAAACRIVLGDARLSLEREPPDVQYDILALDAFSGDAIPVHLLTTEAFDVYLRHMKPGGIIAVHISNRHLRLEPVVAGIAEHFHLGMVSMQSKSEYSDLEPNEDILIASDWVLLTENERFLALPEIRAAAKSDPARLADGAAKRPVCYWTDDFSDMFSILRW